MTGVLLQSNWCSNNSLFHMNQSTLCTVSLQCMVLKSAGYWVLWRSLKSDECCLWHHADNTIRSASPWPCSSRNIAWDVSWIVNQQLVFDNMYSNTQRTNSCIGPRERSVLRNPPTLWEEHLQYEPHVMFSVVSLSSTWLYHVDNVVMLTLVLSWVWNHAVSKLCLFKSARLFRCFSSSNEFICRNTK